MLCLLKLAKVSTEQCVKNLTPHFTNQDIEKLHDSPKGREFTFLEMRALFLVPVGKTNFTRA